MNAKTAEQIRKMKEQTIGVEVEMNHITREKAAKVAADFFGTGRYEYTARRNGYYTWSAWDAQGREWKFQRDISISGPDDEKCELVTPVLRYDDIETLQELIRRLRKAGAISHAGIGAGVHIHIGANGHTAQALRNLTNLMASHERLIADALKIDSGRMHQYCRSKTGSYLTIEKKKGGTVPVAVWAVSAADEQKLDRYEGFPTFYYKTEMTITVKPIGGGRKRKVTAFVYIMHEDRMLGIPSPTYIRTCLTGYHTFGFDDKFIWNAIDKSKEGAYEGSKWNVYKW